MSAASVAAPVAAALVIGGVVTALRSRKQAATAAPGPGSASTPSPPASLSLKTTGSTQIPLSSADCRWEADEMHAGEGASPSSGDRVKHLGLTQRFVLTGGPCAGKTTALARLSQFLTSRQFNVFIVPEAATMLWTGGANLDMIQTPDNTIAFQSALMNIQIALEDQFTAVARLEARRTGRPSIVICDRGLLDGRAYMNDEDWKAMLAQNGLDNEVTLRDSRYHCVLHMVTAAQGAEQHYTLANNPTRTETAQHARELDAKLLNCWAGHPRLRVFENNTDFEGKMQAVISQVSAILGMPASRRRFRRFMLVPGSWDPAAAAASHAVRIETFDVEKVYVQAPPDTARGGSDPTANLKFPYAFVRKRTQGKSAAYGHTLVRAGADGRPIETKRIMSARGYDNAVRLYADDRHDVVVQKRSIFMWQGQYCEVNEYLAPTAASGMCLLSVQATDEESEGGQAVAGDSTVDGDPGMTPVPPPEKSEGAAVQSEAAWLKLPGFLRIQQEVTGEKAYSAYTLSKTA